jgi:dTDP-4-dehydrorhamnose reductase
MGEQLALSNCAETIVIRTSWVYSVHGNNFVKTMLRLMGDRPELNVVGDQIGSPTYAADLAKTILKIVESIELGHAHYGIYHYSNAGVISWFEFATAIALEGRKNCKVFSIPSSAYPTPAKRPGYSVMDCSKLVKEYGIELINWELSLGKCVSKLLSN